MTLSTFNVFQDGTVRCWDWKEGRLLDTVMCSKSAGGDVPEAVTGLCCSEHGSPPIVVASLERCVCVCVCVCVCDDKSISPHLPFSSPILLVFTLSSDGKLTQCSEATITLATPPLSLTFDWSDRLWVCLLHQPEPLLCYHYHGNKVIQ